MFSVYEIWPSKVEIDVVEIFTVRTDSFKRVGTIMTSGKVRFLVLAAILDSIGKHN